MPDYFSNLAILLTSHLGMPASKNDEEGGGRGGTETKPPDESTMIPKPNYQDQKSRDKYLSQWQGKYGPLEGRGDHVLKVNEVPRGASDTAKNVSVKAAKQYGLSPSLLYASSMEEGMSGLFKDKSGLDTRHRKPGDVGYQGYYGDKEFPINGNESFGMPDFAGKFPELVKKGYLSKDFASRFRGKEGEFSANDFKTVEDGMKAKAALLKSTYDDIGEYAKDHGISLSNKAKDFFALAEYNGGPGGFKKLMNKYNEAGLLKDDKFLKERPNKDKIPEKDDIWSHVMRRIKMSDALQKEGLF